MKNIIANVAVFALLFSVAAFAEGPDGNAGAPAPDFTLEAVDGTQFSLSSIEDKVIIMDFWATWCPPCRKGIPDLVELQKEYKDDLVIIGVSVDQANTIGNVPSFVNEYGINYPVVYASQEMLQEYMNTFGNIQGIPTAFIFDKDKNYIERHTGLMPKSVYANTVQELLAE